MENIQTADPRQEDNINTPLEFTDCLPLKREISIFKNAYVKDGEPPIETITFGELAERIQSGYYAKPNANLAELHTTDKQQYDRRKLLLPAITSAGSFASRRGEPVERSGFVVVDIDAKQNPQIARNAAGELDGMAYDDPYFFWGTVSPSGAGVKIIYFNDPSVSHVALFKAACDHVERTHDFVVDRSRAEINALCFIPDGSRYTDQDGYSINRSILKSGALPLPIPEGIHKRSQNVSSGPNCMASISTQIADLAKTQAGIGMNHNDKLNRTAFLVGQSVSTGSISEPEAREHLKSAGMAGATTGSERKVVNTIERGLQAGIENPPIGPLTDSTNAEMLTATFLDMAYNSTLRKWVIYENGAWRIDEKNSVLLRGKETARALDAYANTISDDSLRATVKKFALKSENARSIEATLKLSTAHRPVVESEMDSNPHYFNCKNGTLNLEDHSFHEHRLEDYLSKQSNVDYDPTALCPEWEEFVASVFPNAELRSYVQTVISITLIGRQTVQALFFLYGEGANGKTTMIESLLKMLGDYGQHMPPEALLARKSTGGASSELARLKGARLVVANELPNGAKWDDQTVKVLSGGDTLAARPLYGEYYEWEPTHTIFVIGNFAPQFSGEDPAMVRRIKVIPFEAKFPPEKARPQDELFAIFKKEGSGILNWLLDGLRNFQASGLKEPEIVSASSNQYADDNNLVRTFLRENVQKGSGDVAGQRMYTRYSDWCKDTGAKPMGRKRFYQAAEREATKLFGARKRSDHRGSVSFEGMEFLPLKDDIDDSPF